MDELSLAKKLFGKEKTLEDKASATVPSSASFFYMTAVTSSSGGEVVLKPEDEDSDDIWETGEAGVDFIELDEEGDFDEEAYDNEDELEDVDDTPLDLTDGDGADIEGSTTESATFTVEAYHTQAVAEEEEQEVIEDELPDESMEIGSETDDGDATDIEDDGDPSVEDDLDESLEIGESTDDDFTAVDDNSNDESDDPLEDVEISDGATIVETTASIKEGDRVAVVVQDGNIVVLGVVGAGDEMQANLDLAQETAEEASNLAETAQTAADTAQTAAQEAKSLADGASVSANEAKTLAESASAKADAAEAAVEPIQTDIETLKKDRDSFTESLETLENTMKTDYAKSTDLVLLESDLQTQITQNAAEISSVASSVDTVKIESADAKAMAQSASDSIAAAQADITAANTKAQEAADQAAAAEEKAQEAETALETAQQALEELESRTDATEADITKAQEAVSSAQAAAEAADAAADQAKTDAAAAQAAADKAAADAKAAQDEVAALTSRVTTAETKIEQNSEAITLRATKTEVTQAVDDINVGGRNYIKYGRGNVKDGFFAYFDSVNDDYGEHAFTSQATYERIDIASGFVLGGRDYEVGKEIVFSYDIMYTAWDFPSGTDRKEFWIGQRYESQKISGGDTTGQWRSITSHSLPRVGQNGCELNKWYRVEYKTTIPEQAAEGIVVGSSIQFHNSNADVAASFAFRMKNVKLEYGNKATDWTPAPEDVSDGIEDAQTTANDASEVAGDNQSRITSAEANIELLSESISAMVSKTEEDGTVTSLMTQTETGWTFDMSQILSTVEGTSGEVDSLSKSVDGISGEVESLNAATADFGKILSYVSIETVDEQPRILLGSNTSDFKVIITNTDIRFNAGETSLATIDYESLNIKKANIQEELQFGGFAFVERTNGNMGLVWRG